VSKMLLSRRQLLRAAGGAALALPLLNFVDGRRAAHAEPTEFPKRLILMFSPNGTIPAAWTPTGGETDFALGRILAPLQPHRDKLLILDNVDMESAYHGPGDGHQTGMGSLWTGIELLEGTEFKGGGDSGTAGWGGGPSVDQHIAKTVGATTRLPSLDLGVQVGGATVWSRMLYKAANQPVPPEEDPGRVFDRVFGSLDGDPTGLAKLRARRKSVLDGVAGDFRRLDTMLASEDRLKVERYAEALRDIESRLDTTGALGASCVKPSRPAALSLTDSANFPAIGKLQMDLLVMAMACDQTRVGSLQWSRSVGGKVHSWQGITEGHHDLSHKGDTDAAAQEALTKINTWYAEQLAYLINAMKQIPEGTGTMLDNSVIVWGNELGVGNRHTRRDVPFVMAGGCAGYFKTGRYLKYATGTKHNNLLLSLCRAMGLSQQTSFGNPAYCTGELARLTG
jgi:hypothetical protein